MLTSGLENEAVELSSGSNHGNLESSLCKCDPIDDKNRSSTLNESVLCDDEDVTGNYCFGAAEHQLHVSTKSNLNEDGSLQKFWAARTSNPTEERDINVAKIKKQMLRI